MCVCVCVCGWVIYQLPMCKIDIVENKSGEQKLFKSVTKRCCKRWPKIYRKMLVENAIFMSW